MTHLQFQHAFRAGTIRVDIDPKGAARFISARLMLPFFMLPILGAGVGLALVGWIWTGLAIIAVGIVVPRLIKRGAPRFIVNQALEDERMYADAVAAGVLRIEKS